MLPEEAVLSPYYTFLFHDGKFWTINELAAKYHSSREVVYRLVQRGVPDEEIARHLILQDVKIKPGEQEKYTHKPKEKCVMFRKKLGKVSCDALSEMLCCTTGKCSFYKTRKDVEKDEEIIRNRKLQLMGEEEGYF